MDMAGYTKLFNSILHSTIWSEPNETRILWITMLAMADKHGDVNASIPGLARMAGITIEETQQGLAKFHEPDQFSRTPDHGGRRIETITGGWHLLNHGKYREMMSVEERREYNRKKQAERRARVKPDGDMSMTVNDNQQSVTKAEAKAEAEAKAVKTRAAKAPSETDEEWLASLGKEECYRSLSVTAEFGKASRWCDVNNKKCTRRFFLNWINRAASNARPIQASVSVSRPAVAYDAPRNGL